MAGARVDLATWHRAEHFRYFRTFDRPHFSLTSRVDVTQLMKAKTDRGLSPFRACLWAIGAGIHAVPALCLRFDGDAVWSFPRIVLSPTIPMEDGRFGFGYFDWQPDFKGFDAEAEAIIAAVRSGQAFAPGDGSGLALAYMSCLPWIDFTSLDNALRSADDCIPRFGWGKIVPKGDGYDMAVGIQVHHALVEGADVGQFFNAMQDALNGFG